MSEVNLLSHTHSPERVMWTAGKTCISVQDPLRIWMDNHDMAFRMNGDMSVFDEYFERLHNSGHWSVFEHVNFVFSIKHMTRYTMSQIIRHRHLSFSIQSLRYVDLSGQEVVIENPRDIFVEEDIYESVNMYNFLVNRCNVEPEEARAVLPMGLKVNGVVSGNLRALLDVSSLRRCVLAQEGVRNIFHQMRREVYKVRPIFGRAMMIKCQRSGYCDEMKNKSNRVCGIRPHIDTMNLKTLKLVR